MNGGRLCARSARGCPELFEAVFRTSPRLHVFGHIHAGYGTLRTTDTLFVNASLMGEDGSLSRRPVVIDLQVR
jgi:Icc-related predicted phosphoesterase